MGGLCCGWKEGNRLKRSWCNSSVCYWHGSQQCYDCLNCNHQAGAILNYAFLFCTTQECTGCFAHLFLEIARTYHPSLFPPFLKFILFWFTIFLLNNVWKVSNAPCWRHSLSSCTLRCIEVLITSSILLHPCDHLYVYVCRYTEFYSSSSAT